MIVTITVPRRMYGVDRGYYIAHSLVHDVLDFRSDEDKHFAHDDRQSEIYFTFGDCRKGSQ